MCEIKSFISLNDLDKYIENHKLGKSDKRGMAVKRPKTPVISTEVDKPHKDTKTV
jgi:hypothetical protein